MFSRRDFVDLSQFRFDFFSNLSFSRHEFFYLIQDLHQKVDVNINLHQGGTSIESNQ